MNNWGKIQGKSLSEYVSYQRLTGESDIQIIRRWFIENEREEEGIKLMAELSAAKLEKVKSVLNGARAWIPNNMTPMDKNGNRYPEQVEYRLMQIIHCYQLQMDLSDQLVEWAREFFPKTEFPSIIFFPAIEWVEERYGIKFKGAKS